MKPKLNLKQRVLFVCMHNSARSQIAEAFLNKLCPGYFLAESAGIEAGKLNPLAVEVMREVDIDISHKKPRTATDAVMSGRLFSIVITVCDAATAERCPDFPGESQRLRWNFPDPSTFQGTRAEKLAKTREVRDAIKHKIEKWCGEVTQPGNQRRIDR